MNEQERAAHLGRAWDTFRRMDLERCDPDDVATVRSLIALDRLPQPDPRFVARLERALAGTGATAQLPPLHWPSAQVAGPVADHRTEWPLPELPLWNRRPTLARWAAAGMAVLICGAVTFLALQAGSDDDAPTSLPAYGDASTVALPWQETPECDVPARSVDSFRTLLALSASFSQPVPPPLDEIGVPADGATTSQVEVTMREVLACRTARETGREYALYSNDALLRADRLGLETQDFQVLETLLWSAEFVANMVGTPVPSPSYEESLLVSIQDSRLLADGRVRATVLYEIGKPREAGSEMRAFVAFFVEHDGIYLIDDAEGFTYSVMAPPFVDRDEGNGSTAGGINTGQAIGTTSGTVVVDYPTGDPPPPVPTENMNPGNTSGGAAVGGAAVGGAAAGGTASNLPSRSTPSPADD